MTDPTENAFHNHLDDCEQCREHPMELCREGARILQAVVREYKSAKAVKGIFE